MKKRFLICVLGFILLSAWLNGESLSEKIQLNGFLSQAYVYSTNNDFIEESSRNGSFEMNEFGLTFAAEVSDKLRIGFQLLARDFGSLENHKIKLDWGFADYRFSNAFGIRAGKVKSPVALYNEIRDTDALHPMAVLPQSIYDETMRDTMISYDGIGIYGKINTHWIGAFNYHMYMGTVNHHPEAPYMTQIHDAINFSLSQAGMGIGPLQMNSQLFHGGKLIWTPFRGLRLGGSYMVNRSRYKSPLSAASTDLGMLTGKMEIKNCFYLMGEISLGNLILVSEYMEFPVYMYVDQGKQSLLVQDEVQQGFYIMGYYLIGDKVTLSAYYDVFYASKDDHKGLTQAALGQPDYFGWQKDLAFGLRYDINFNWTLKVDWHMMNGMAKSYVFMDRSNFFDTKEKWNMFVAKIAFNF